MSTEKTASETLAAAAAGQKEAVETMTTLYTKGIERIVEVQRKGLEQAATQNAELLDSWKKIAQVVPGAPGLLFLDLASNAFDRFAGTQKGAIELILEQSHAFAGLVKERATSTIQSGESAAAMALQAVEQSVAAQKKALDYSATQTKAALEDAKLKFGLAGTPAEQATESFQRGVDTMIETQKEILDIAAKPFSTVN